MRLEKASTKAIKYSCLNFHYSKAIPSVSQAYSVFNDKDEWCGVIAYGVGANSNIANQFLLNNGEVIELVRVALNGKIQPISKVVSLSMKLLKKHCPLVKLLVSYADMEQNHQGIIYQAMNWYYVGDSIHNHHENIKTGKFLHNRIYSELPKDKKALYKTKKSKPKRKYIYPLNKEMILLCEKLKKPYPKSVKSIDSDATPFQEDEGSANLTLTHHLHRDSTDA